MKLMKPMNNNMTFIRLIVMIVLTLSLALSCREELCEPACTLSECLECQTCAAAMCFDDLDDGPDSPADCRDHSFRKDNITVCQ